MGLCGNVTRHQRRLFRLLSTTKRHFATRKRVFLIAGEPSGDAIGCKLVHALTNQARHHALQLEFSGVGGPLMCAAGGFDSLFPMQELSHMGLVELLPHLWRLRRRMHETVDAIKCQSPDVLVTIDSKGFCFGVLKALYKQKPMTDLLRFHYVAPSVWAYHNRRGQDYRELKKLVDHMFVLLPFEARFFNENQGHGEPWCSFVGHPALEDFYDSNGLFEPSPRAREEDPIVPEPLYHMTERWLDAWKKLQHSATDPLIDWSSMSGDQVIPQAQALSIWMEHTRNSPQRAETRAQLGVSCSTLVVCALVGSRQQEVEKVMPHILKALSEFSFIGERICVVFPTLGSLIPVVHRALSEKVLPFQRLVFQDLSASDKLRLFQASDIAIATSGTVVTETTLAGLPTAVVYRTNAITHQIAQWMAAVRYVSIPNLLLGQKVLPELLFDDCNQENIYRTLRQLAPKPTSRAREMLTSGGSQGAQEEEDPWIHQAQIAMALSTLTKWTHHQPHKKGAVGEPNRLLAPLRPSDEAAQVILQKLLAK